MKKKTCFALAAGLLAAFAAWTAILCRIDVQAIGPEGSTVGLAGLNSFVRNAIGVHMALYVITDWLSLLPAGLAVGFAGLGLAQWIKRKRLSKVDRSLVVLGGFYLALLAVYVLFEKVVINHRPVLIDGKLEASYPSSTTVLVLCVTPTAIMQLRQRLRRAAVRRWVIGGMAAYTVLMAAGRLLSGVHWVTDIIGGMLISAALVMLYHAVCLAIPRGLLFQKKRP